MFVAKIKCCHDDDIFLIRICASKRTLHLRCNFMISFLLMLCDMQPLENGFIHSVVT